VGPPSAVAAVIFDWGGTLTPWHDIDGAEIFRRVAAALVADPADPADSADAADPADSADAADPAAIERVALALYTAEEAAWAVARTEHRSGTIHDSIRAAGHEPSEAALDAWYLGYEPHTYADPEARAVLAGLRERGIKVGILSNTGFPRAWHERIFARDGLLALIDGAVYTSEIPWVKPHQEAFTAAMAAVGVTDPASVVFVGDRLFDDIHGAKSAGMRAVWIPHSRIPADQRGHTDGEPDAVIERLSDLLTVLDGWRGSPD